MHIRKTRFQYTYQDALESKSSLINIDQLSLTRIDNQILYQSSRTDIKIRIYTSRSSHLYQDLDIEIVIGDNEQNNLLLDSKR